MRASAGADPLDTAVGFARTLRAAGVPASPDRVHAMVVALSALDPRRRDHVYWAGRATLCSDVTDVQRYDRVFAAYFSGIVPQRQQVPKVAREVVTPVPALPQPRPGDAPPLDDEPLTSVASDVEVLRNRDFAVMTAQEREQMVRLLAAMRLPGEQRRVRRHRRAHHGQVDRAATVRAMLRRGGESARPLHRKPRTRPRRVVLLVDVSGSMSPYAAALLRFAHATARREERVGGPTVEVFTVGTRLTRVTRQLSHRDPDTAFAAASAEVPDWSGGTRLGELLKEFLDRFGQRAVARGAIVVLLSDGWERGDATLLGEQMARLSRLAHRVVWANPLKVRPGYAPLVAGMAAALPHVDDFVEGHSLAALEHLAAVVAGAGK